MVRSNNAHIWLGLLLTWGQALDLVSPAARTFGGAVATPGIPSAPTPATSVQRPLGQWFRRTRTRFILTRARNNHFLRGGDLLHGPEPGKLRFGGPVSNAGDRTTTMAVGDLPVDPYRPTLSTRLAPVCLAPFCLAPVCEEFPRSENSECDASDSPTPGAVGRLWKRSRRSALRAYRIVFKSR